MSKYVSTDADGFVVGFYDMNLHGSGGIPAGAIAISDQEYAAWVVNQAGFRIVNGMVVSVATGTDLAVAKTLALAKLRGAAAAAILGGFCSSALGAQHTYPSGQNDQVNLATAVAASTGAPSDWSAAIWCADPNGDWHLLQHNAAQVAQVSRDMVSARSAIQAKLATLSAQVAAATDAAAATALVWS